MKNICFIFVKIFAMPIEYLNYVGEFRLNSDEMVRFYPIYLLLLLIYVAAWNVKKYNWIFNVLEISSF